MTFTHSPLDDVCGDPHIGPSLPAHAQRSALAEQRVSDAEMLKQAAALGHTQQQLAYRELHMTMTTSPPELR